MKKDEHRILSLNFIETRS